MKQLENLKIVLGIEHEKQDALLTLLLDDIKIDILGYTRRNTEQWLAVFDSIQRKLAVIAYNNLGVEGASSRSEGDVSTSFFGIDDWSNSIKTTLNQYRLIKGVTQ